MGKSDNAKVCSILSYVLIGVIWYFVDESLKKNKTARFHAKQGLVLFIGTIIYNFVLGLILSIILIPLIGTGADIMVASIFRLLYYVPLVLIIMGMLNAANGREKSLPVIGKYAEKLNF